MTYQTFTDNTTGNRDQSVAVADEQRRNVAPWKIGTAVLAVLGVCVIVLMSFGSNREGADSGHTAGGRGGAASAPTETPDDCYSYAGIKTAKHRQTIKNCGGRKCSCFDGTLTCQAMNKTRVAYHAISDATKQRYVNALNWINTQNDTALGNYLGTSNARSYNSVLVDHVTHRDISQTTSKFLPWHRCIVCEFEQMLQLYDVCLTIPYWYHPADSGPGMVNYHVLDKAYLGDEFPPFGQLNSPWNVPPSYHPLSRGQDNDNNPLADSAAIATLLSHPDFATYRNDAEGFLHQYIPHVEVGGSFATYESPADPLFWMHHGMVDRNWDDWRVANGGDYDNDKDVLVSPQWGVTVGDVMDGVGLWTPSETIYKNNELPTGDHCAVHYVRPFDIFMLDLDSFPLFIPDGSSFEQLLAERFEPEELNVRLPDDPLMAALVEANPNVTSQEDCSQLQLPSKISDFADSFGVSVERLQGDLCNLALRSVETEYTTIRIPAFLDVSDDMQDVEPCSGAVKLREKATLYRLTNGRVGAKDFRTIAVPIKREELVKRIGAQECPGFEEE